MKEEQTIKNFELLKKKGQPLAYTKKIDHHLIVFGTRFLEQKMLKELFPEFQFYFLKQVHGNRVVPAHSLSPTADGHFTSQKNQALCLRTADCLPVFIIRGENVFALHIGWRGIHNKILDKALSSTPSPNPLPQSWGRGLKGFCKKWGGLLKKEGNWGREVDERG